VFGGTPKPDAKKAVLAAEHAFSIDDQRDKAAWKAAGRRPVYVALEQ